MRVLERPDLPTVKQWKPNNAVQTKPSQWTAFVIYVKKPLKQINKTVRETETGDQDSSTGTENHAPFFTLFILLNLSYFLHTGPPTVIEIRDFYYIFPQLRAIWGTSDGAWGTRHMEFLCSTGGWMWACILQMLNGCPEKADSLKISATDSLFHFLPYLVLLLLY